VLQILQEARAGTAVKVLCAKHNISPATFHAWKRKFGGGSVHEVRRLRALTEETARLKRLVADGLLQIQILKEWFAKKFGRKSYLLPA
jgi:putative transposase